MCEQSAMWKRLSSCAVWFMRAGGVVAQDGIVGKAAGRTGQAQGGASGIASGEVSR